MSMEAQAPANESKQVLSTGVPCTESQTTCQAHSATGDQPHLATPKTLVNQNTHHQAPKTHAEVTSYTQLNRLVFACAVMARSFQTLPPTAAAAAAALRFHVLPSCLFLLLLHLLHEVCMPPVGQLSTAQNLLLVGRAHTVHTCRQSKSHMVSPHAAMHESSDNARTAPDSTAQ